MERFTDQQIAQLRGEYSKVKRASTDSLVRFGAIFQTCSDDALKQLAAAQISFVSKLALNECVRRHIPLYDVRVYA